MKIQTEINKFKKYYTKMFLSESNVNFKNKKVGAIINKTTNTCLVQSDVNRYSAT